ncbi:MAG: ABC transporter, ATP-binding protein (cluster 1, maltose/g3p/polyamine/iron); ABC transporter, ATP-binding protein (cluster 10, nitrate/sulfonate/bicarbonate) [uncultured Frankineae bacterium]|uniref:ABC-type quaternary amine transporter n=1 Tax=uncultured Frankineae bacterium TaxID=437475 RepID=A0A6J4KYH3_9ACTN|nr:MAG: ABC transporter, ATP-binding protein (cluster 1, maltose/g3p/polyamine/iron); ABC transporter, ATP-binding protein (cluster 10, nitrate/sulfonate/bicarbonate) [uncultured Frankineae bacterium]
MTSGAGVHLVDLHRAYAGVPALDGLDLRVEPGELVSLLGPSGCGKTTALRVLGGLETVDRGQVLVGGKDVTDVPAHRRDMGMVFQAYSLFPNLTARDNVGFGLRLRKVSGAEERRRAGELLELVGLGQQAGKYPHQMSGGQQQRVALARALAIQPRVLLLDEPLSALDAQVRVALREEIRRIQTELAITTLFVTHDQEEALAISDRVGVMSRGRLEQLAAPATVYQQPATPFVAEFIGVTNSFAGTVADGAVLLPEGNRLPASVVAQRPAGSPVRVLVRPGDLQVRTDGPGALAGTVLTQSFLGPVTRLGVKLPQGDVVRVDVPSERAAATPTGASVELSVDPGAAMLATDGAA